MLKKYFVAGLLIWLPLAATLWVLDFIVSTMDRTLLLLPQGWRPDALFGVHIPGFGLVLSVTVLLLTGMLAANFLGAHLLRGWETLLNRIPIVRSINSKRSRSRCTAGKVTTSQASKIQARNSAVGLRSLEITPDAPALPMNSAPTQRRHSH